MALAGLLVALLAGVRFSVDGPRTDLLLAAGFLSGRSRPLPSRSCPCSTAARSAAPTAGRPSPAACSATRLIAAAPFVRGRSRLRDRALAQHGPRRRRRARWPLWSCCARPAAGCRALNHRRAWSTRRPGSPRALAVQALLALLAVVGWGSRFAKRETISPLARARLHAAALRGAASRASAAARDDLRLGGRLPAPARVCLDPRRRLARDPLRRVRARGRRRAGARGTRDPRRARAVSVRRLDPCQMLEVRCAGRGGRRRSSRRRRCSRSRRRASRSSRSRRRAAPRRSTRRFAAMSSSSPLTATSRSTSRSTPGSASRRTSRSRSSASCRRASRTSAHANATHAEVMIGERPSGERFVADRGRRRGLQPEATTAGQGLKNMRDRAMSIDGGFSVRSTPGRGTALEVVLRT